MKAIWIAPSLSGETRLPRSTTTFLDFLEPRALAGPQSVFSETETWKLKERIGVRFARTAIRLEEAVRSLSMATESWLPASGTESSGKHRWGRTVFKRNARSV